MFFVGWMQEEMGFNRFVDSKRNPYLQSFKAAQVTTVSVTLLKSYKEERNHILFRTTETLLFEAPSRSDTNSLIAQIIIMHSEI